MSRGAEFFDPAELATRALREELHFWHRHRRRVVLDLLRKASPGGGLGRLLDLGCGVGTVATYLNEHGFRVDYADVHPEALALSRAAARERLGPAADERRFLCLDATRPLAVTGYGGILLLDVLEHLPDDEEVLSGLRTALAGSGEGLLLVTVPAFGVLWTRWDDMERHRRRYAKQQLVHRLRGAGFSPLRAGYFFAPLLAPVVAVKLLRALRGGQRAAGSFAEAIEIDPPRIASRLLGPLLAIERRLLRRVDLPAGTSLFAVARRVA